MFFGLDDYAIEQVIFKNSMREDMKNALKTIAWPETKWHVTPTRKYKLFLHNPNTQANVWLFFVKKKFMPMRHANMISLEKAMLLYCIMEEIPINVGKIICEHIHA